MTLKIIKKLYGKGASDFAEVLKEGIKFWVFCKAAFCQKSHEYRSGPFYMQSTKGAAEHYFMNVKQYGDKDLKDYHRLLLAYWEKSYPEILTNVLKYVSRLVMHFLLTTVLGRHWI